MLYASFVEMRFVPQGLTRTLGGLAYVFKLVNTETNSVVIGTFVDYWGLQASQPSFKFG